MMENLEIFAQTLKDRKNRELTPSEWKTLKSATDDLFVGTEPVSYPGCASLFRCLRNACANCPANQRAIIECRSLFEGSLRILEAILDRMEENSPQLDDVLIAARCGLQFLGNFSVSNEAGSAALWDRFFKKGSLGELSSRHRDRKLMSYAAFLLFNCLSSCKVVPDDLLGLTVTLARQFVEYDCDWSLRCLQSLLQTESFLVSTYSRIAIDQRLLLLDVMIEEISEDNSPSKPNIGSVKETNRLFKESVTSENDPREIGRLLEVLCAASASEEYSRVLKQDVPLLETCLGVLKDVHKSGNDDSISPAPATNEEASPNPTSGLKCRLIRLLANLVHHSTANQDAVRIRDGIPLILDCCKIDSRNPFITQWCIFAIRNLMEGNTNNQQALAAVTLREPVDSPILGHMRLQVTADGKLTPTT